MTKLTYKLRIMYVYAFFGISELWRIFDNYGQNAITYCTRVELIIFHPISCLNFAVKY